MGTLRTESADQGQEEAFRLYFAQIISAPRGAPTRLPRGPRRHLTIAAIAVTLALVAGVLVVALRPSNTSTVNVGGSSLSAPSGPAVTRHRTFGGDLIAVSFPHSSYPAGGKATATVTINLGRAARLDHVCVDQVLQLDFVPVGSDVHPSWAQGHCAATLTIGRVDRLHITTAVPDRPDAYLTVLETQHLHGVALGPLPITVGPANGPLRNAS